MNCPYFLLFNRLKEKSPKTVHLGTGPSKQSSDTEDDDDDDDSGDETEFYENIVSIVRPSKKKCV